MLRKSIFRKRRTPPPINNILMMTLILFVIMIVLSIILINKGIKPTIMEIAKVKTTEFATRGINAAVRFSEEYDFDDFAEVTLTQDGYVSTFTWDSAKVSEINRVSTDRVEEFFKRMNEGKSPDYEESHLEPEDYGDTAEDIPKKDPTVVEIPVGRATGNTILANLGPKIPVNLEFVGNVKTDVITESDDIGINGTLVTIYVLVEAEVQVIIPFSTEVKEVSTKIYVGKSLVMGEVPEFYGGDSNNPSIAVPKDSITGDEE